jgi:hypothetical protein
MARRSIPIRTAPQHLADDAAVPEIVNLPRLKARASEDHWKWVRYG